jgi:hypothetical protein
MNRAQRRYLDADARRARDRGQINTRSTSWARDDREWFQRWPDRSHRVRDRFPGEEFGSRDDPTLDMVAVRQISTGVRVRSPFEIPASPCARYVREAAATEHGASILFDLAMRGGDCRCDLLVALLDRQKIPNGRVH